MDGTKAVIQGLHSNPTSVASVAKAWARLKREAVVKEDMFKSMLVNHGRQNFSQEFEHVLF